MNTQKQVMNDLKVFIYEQIVENGGSCSVGIPKYYHPDIIDYYKKLGFEVAAYGEDKKDLLITGDNIWKQRNR